MSIVKVYIYYLPLSPKHLNNTSTINVMKMEERKPACLSQFDNTNPKCVECHDGYHCYHLTYSGYE